MNKNELVELSTYLIFSLCHLNEMKTSGIENQLINCQMIVEKSFIIDN